MANRKRRSSSRRSSATRGQKKSKTDDDNASDVESQESQEENQEEKTNVTDTADEKNVPTVEDKDEGAVDDDTIKDDEKVKTDAKSRRSSSRRSSTKAQKTKTDKDDNVAENGDSQEHPPVEQSEVQSEVQSAVQIEVQSEVQHPPVEQSDAANTVDKVEDEESKVEEDEEEVYHSTESHTENSTESHKEDEQGSKNLHLNEEELERPGNVTSGDVSKMDVSDCEVGVQFEGKDLTCDETPSEVQSEEKNESMCAENVVKEDANIEGENQENKMVEVTNDVTENKPMVENINAETNVIENNISLNMVEMSELDATDSQLCIFDEAEDNKSNETSKLNESQNFGLRSGSEIVKDLMQDLADMNRLITRARNDLNATKARLSTKWQVKF